MKVVEFLRGRQLSLHPLTYAALREAADRGEDMPRVEARALGTEEAGPSKIAVMPMFGVLTQHYGYYGTSTEAFGREFMRVVDDPSFATIIIEANSPGGEVCGTPELADLIFQSRKKKRIITHGNSMIASAMCWIGMAASEVYLNPSGEIGSIGVLTWHVDVSKWEDQTGQKTELLSDPPAKIEGHPFAPLPDEVRQRIMGELADTKAMFHAAVAKYRGVKPSVLRDGFGAGRMVGAKQALAEGMIDGIITLRDLIAREVAALGKKSKASNYAAAMLRVTEAMK